MLENQSTDPATAPPFSFGAGKAFVILLAWIGGQLLGGVGGAISAMIYLLTTGTELADTDAINTHLAQILTPALLAGTLLGAVAMVVATWFLARPIIRRADETGIGWQAGSTKELVVSAITGVLISSVYVVGVLVLDPSIPDEDLGTVARLVEDSRSVRWAWAFIAVAIAPVTEEFLFRGVLFSGLARSWGIPAGAASVSALFLLFHLSETIGFWPATVAIGSLTIGTIAARLITNRLGPPVAMHLAYNVVLAIALLV